MTQLDLSAIHAPLTWVFPHADESERAWLPRSGAVIACSHVDGFGHIEQSADGAAAWIDVV